MPLPDHGNLESFSLYPIQPFSPSLSLTPSLPLSLFPSIPACRHPPFLVSPIHRLPLSLSHPPTYPPRLRVAAVRLPLLLLRRPPSLLRLPSSFLTLLYLLHLPFPSSLSRLPSPAFPRLSSHACTSPFLRYLSCPFSSLLRFPRCSRTLLLRLSSHFLRLASSFLRSLVPSLSSRTPLLRLPSHLLRLSSPPLLSYALPSPLFSSLTPSFSYIRLSHTSFPPVAPFRSFFLVLLAAFSRQLH